MLLTMNSSGIFYYGIPLYEKIPKYQCRFAGEDRVDFWRACNVTQVCNPDQFGVESFRTDFDDEYSFKALVQQLGLQCMDKAEIGLIGSAIFLGWSIGCVVIAPLADKFGRRTPFLVCNFVNCIIVSLFLVITDIRIFIFFCFIFGMMRAGTYSVGYVFFVEQLPKSHRIQLGLLIDLFEAAVIIYIGLYLQYASQNWIWLQLFGIASMLTGTTICFFVVKETPRFLLARGKRSSAFLKLRRMASWNDSLEQFELHVAKHRIKTVDEQGELQQQYSLLEGLRQDPVLKINFLLMMTVWALTSTSYYIVNFDLKYLRGSIFVNNLSAAIAEILAVLLAGFFYLRFGLKKALFFSYIISTIGAFCIILFEESHTDLVPIFVLMAKFGLGSAFGLIYLSNFIFPTKYAS